MDQELKTKLKSALNKCNMAVNGMMAPDTADEEKGAWVQIYNFNMARIINDYLAEDDVPQEAPSEEPSAEAGEVVVEDVGGITNAE